MRDKKVSIAIPVYNVENYLDKCVESIVNQTYKNLEIILVDDGSTDRSGEICDQWAKRDKRIKVVHKENGGLSSARNAGMKNATGKYILFEDSDDWVDKELVEKCVERIEQDKSDLVIFGYKKVDERGGDLGSFTFGNETLSRDEITEQLFKRILEMSFGYAWNKMYNLKVLRESNLEFDGSIIDREDLVFNMQLLSVLNRVSYLDFAGYYYLQRKTSLLHNSNLARLKNIKPFCESMCDIKLGNKELEQKVYNMNVLHYLSDCIIKNLIWNKKLSKKEKIKLIKETIDDCPNIDMLYADEDNPRHLNILYKTIIKENPKYFYWYVKLSDLKRIIVHK